MYDVNKNLQSDSVTDLSKPKDVPADKTRQGINYRH